MESIREQRAVNLIANEGNYRETDIERRGMEEIIKKQEETE
jgi:hypothetical protein